MPRVRFDHSAESVRLYPKIQYDPPSAITEIRTRFLASQSAEAVDVSLEFALGRRLEDWMSISRTAVGTNELKWTAYVSRFAIHLVKGIFAGAGMYTMDALLVRRLHASK